MTDLSRYDPISRFTGLSGAYSKYRPTYPMRAVDYILDRCGLERDSVLVDLGSGTGISSQLFARQYMRVIGVEPNADMRREAESKPDDELEQRITYVDGRAESTGLPWVPPTPSWQPRRSTGSTRPRRSTNSAESFGMTSGRSSPALRAPQRLFSRNTRRRPWRPVRTGCISPEPSASR